MLAFGLVRLPVAKPVPAAKRPAIGVSSSSKDEAALLDPSPLFLPTKWNAAQKDIAWPEPGGAFQNYPVTPKWSFSRTDPKLDQLLPPPVATPATMAEALAVNTPGALALGFARTDAQVSPLPLRGAAVAIVSTRTGRRALSAQAMAQVQKLATDARPPSERPWQPFEFLAAVDPAGLVGPLVIVEPRSGVEEVDRYFQDYLVRTIRVGERLAPGFYRISVGP